MKMNMNFTKFPVPVLGDNATQLYTQLYGDSGKNFVDILRSSPDEIAVISRLIAYLCEKKGGQAHGC